MRFTAHRDESGNPYLTTDVRGQALLQDAFLNKDDAFTRDERLRLGIIGMLPDHVSTIEEQLDRVRDQYALKTTEMGKNVYLNGLMDRNETLFYRFLLSDLEETIPVIYTPTVAQACSHWSRIYRRAHGLYITPRDRGRIADVLKARPAMAPPVIVVTDNERILGIGDQGAGGMGIPIGKLSLYTAAGGIHPERCIPISLDVGTNNAELLEDPLYVGVREPRLRGEAYETLVDEFVDAVLEVYPGALVQWEDFANATSFRNLATHQKRIASFNDDIQGTGAMAVAGVQTAIDHAGLRADELRIVISGAGSAGHGIAHQMAFAMEAIGMDSKEAWSRIFVLDSRGLLLTDRRTLRGPKADLASDPSVTADWVVSEDPPSLLDVVENVKPTVLIGVSGQAGLFSEDVVRTMADHCDRPIIMPMSNPTSHTEVTPANAIRWTDGRGLVATGSPFSPVVHDGTTYRIGQANNAFIFPGIGLAVITVGAREITDEMLYAASVALSGCMNSGAVASGQLFPDIEDVRTVSRQVAISVASMAIEQGVADPVDDLEARIDAEMWFPEYVPVRPRA